MRSSQPTFGFLITADPCRADRSAYPLEKELLLWDIDGLELPFLTPGLESEEVADTLFLVN